MIPPIIPAGRPSRRQALVFMGVALAVALLAGVAGMHRAGPMVRLDHALLDGLLRATASGERPDGIVVVDIDEVSLAAAGQWPWPRYRLAALIESIAAAGPAAIALDILLPEPDRASLSEVRQVFRRDFGIDVAISGVPEGLQDNDGYLGQQMARADVVGARYFYFDHVTADGPVPRPGVGFEGELDALAPHQAHGVLDNVDAIASQTRVSGFVNLAVDGDGLIRRLPMVLEYRGVMYPSLALAATMQALGASSARVVEGPHGPSLVVAGHKVPVDRQGRALLRFDAAPAQYPSLPAVEVLAGRHAPQDLRGKVVFIGSSAVGLGDLHQTAAGRGVSGARVQAALVQAILDGRVPRVPAWDAAVSLLAGILLAAALGLMFVAGRRMLALSALALGAVAAMGVLAFVALAGGGLVLPVAAPVLVVLLVLAMAFVTRFAAQQHHARRWRKQLENARQVTIESMSAVAETRDPETGAHIKRTQHYVRAIARQLRRSGAYAELLSEEFIHLLYLSAPLHDIGKVGVPDHILLKPGPLTAEEWVVMRKHAEFGRQIILSTARHIDGENFLSLAAEIAASHHEKWDGTGYPTGLAGQDIPLSGRIMAVADIYDALINRRCYKEPIPHDEAMEIMRSLRGTTFDPMVLDAFLAIEDEITRIARRFRDQEAPPAAAIPLDEQRLARVGVR